MCTSIESGRIHDLHGGGWGSISTIAFAGSNHGAIFCGVAAAHRTNVRWVPSDYLTPGDQQRSCAAAPARRRTGVGSRQYSACKLCAKCLMIKVPGVFVIDSISGSRVHMAGWADGELYGNTMARRFTHEFVTDSSDGEPRLALDSAVVRQRCKTENFLGRICVAISCRPACRQRRRVSHRFPSGHGN